MLSRIVGRIRCWLTAVTGDGPHGEDDAEFIAHAREDVPALVAEVERLIRDGDPAALEAVGLGYLARCGVDEGGKSYHGMRCDCWGPRDRP